jgi:hypothetical protein
VKGEPTTALLGLGLAGIVVRTAEEELLTAAGGLHVLNANMDALLEDPAAHLKKIAQPGSATAMQAFAAPPPP